MTGLKDHDDDSAPLPGHEETLDGGTKKSLRRQVPSLKATIAGAQSNPESDQPHACNQKGNSSSSVDENLNHYVDAH